MERFTLVYCELRDCVSYRPETGQVRKCRCVHPDKPHHMSQLTCPLYRLDWQKQMKALQETEKKKERPKY